MSCSLTGSELYKSHPYKDIFSHDTFDTVTRARCMEQTCFSVGSCLLQPCESLRPIPSLPSSFGLIERYSEPEKKNQSLLCSYLSLHDYNLYYASFEDSKGVNDCWSGLVGGNLLSPEQGSTIRVWEQLGFVDTDKADSVLKDYHNAYTNLIRDARAGSM